MCTPETFTYDPWGNLLTLGANTTTQSNYTGCTQESGFNYTGSIATNNRLAVSGFSYDAAGNMTASPGATYTYDAENHLITTHGVTYAYDGDSRRLTKSSGMMYWYGLNSDPLIETDLSNNLKAHYIFFNGQRVASENSSNSVDWYFADHLGTARLVFSLNGDDQSDFYPFGGERTIDHRRRQPLQIHRQRTRLRDRPRQLRRPLQLVQHGHASCLLTGPPSQSRCRTPISEIHNHSISTPMSGMILYSTPMLTVIAAVGRRAALQIG